MATPIDTSNKFAVSSSADVPLRIRILNPPLTWLSEDEAQNLAAWLLVMSTIGDPAHDDKRARFDRIVAEIEQS